MFFKANAFRGKLNKNVLFYTSFNFFCVHCHFSKNFLRQKLIKISQSMLVFYHINCHKRSRQPACKTENRKRRYRRSTPTLTCNWQSPVASTWSWSPLRYFWDSCSTFYTYVDLCNADSRIILFLFSWYSCCCFVMSWYHNIGTYSYAFLVNVPINCYLIIWY